MEITRSRKEKLEGILIIIFHIFFSGILMIREELKSFNSICGGISIEDIFCYVFSWLFTTIFCLIPLYMIFATVVILLQLIFPEIVAVTIAVLITIKLWFYTAGILGIVVANIGD